MNNPPSGVMAMAALDAEPFARTSSASRMAVLGLPLVVLAILVIGGLTTPSFLGASNLRAVLTTASITGIVAVCMTPITMSGNFVSLATAQSTMLAAVMFAGMIAHGWDPWSATAAVLVVLVVVGAVQAFVCAAGLNPIITTLAAGSIILGCVSAVTESARVQFDREQIAWLSDAQPLGMPLPVYFFIAVTALITAFIHRTRLGREILLTGANPRTAVLSGISVRMVTTVAFVVLSFGATTAGILAVAPMGGADTTFMNALTFDAIAAILVGGTSIHGGHGSPLRSAVGAIIVALLTSLMVLNDFTFGERQAFKGVLVLGVVAALVLLERLEKK
jgi:ribose transport system permease protein